VGGTNGAQIAWSHLVDLEASVSLANAEPNGQGGYIVNSKSRQFMHKTPRSTYLDNIWSGTDTAFPLNGRRAAVTTNVPSNLTKGTASGVCSALLFAADWSQLVIAMIGPVDIVVDPVTRADFGEVVVTVSAYIDIGLRQPAGFAVMLDALTA
ncbi:MAG: phage major capsid protein, partial [Gallionella sp.]